MPSGGAHCGARKVIETKHLSNNHHAVYTDYIQLWLLLGVYWAAMRWELKLVLGSWFVRLVRSGPPGLVGRLHKQIFGAGPKHHW